MPSKIINSCKNNDLEELRGALREAEPLGINDPDHWGRRAIYYAIHLKNVKAIKMLHDHGALLTVTHKINGSDEDLVVTALKTSSHETVLCLIGLLSDTSVGCRHIGANISVYLPYLFRGDATLLEQFIRLFKIHSLKGHESVLCRTSKRCHYVMMLRYNVCFDLQSSLRYTLVYGRYTAFQHLLTLIRYGEQLDFVYRGPHGSRYTLLSLCAINGYYKGLVQLVRAGANMNIVSVNERGETRNNLMTVVDNGLYNTLKAGQQIMIQRCIHYLVQFYDVNEQNSRGQTALMFARRAGNEELVQILLELGADPDIVDMDG